MRKLLVLFALSLTTSAAWAQTDKAPAVTKLPGEEKLSTRERAERDFLMPVRRKKAAELTKPTASAEQLATAAPEIDAVAHYNEAAADPRPEEVATAVSHEAATHSRAARHAAWLAARRAHLREVRAEERADEARAERRAEARRAARHTSKSSKSSKSSKASRAKEAKHHTAAKASKHSSKTASHKTKKVATKTKHHTATHKVKAKAKPAAKHKRRR